MTLILGVDGCPGGWCVVPVESSGSRWMVGAPEIHNSFASVLGLSVDTICIDVPIGLVCGGETRACDDLARQMLGPRWPCVFRPPCRHALAEITHQSASSVNRECTGRGISIQAFNIADRIDDVDKALSQHSSVRVFEVHPELCFLGLNAGTPLLSKKVRLIGRVERWALLRTVFDDLPLDPPGPSELAGRCKLDDYIDALAAAWTAVCIAQGTAVRIPHRPENDARGLSMEMWLPG